MFSRKDNAPDRTYVDARTPFGSAGKIDVDL